MLDRKKEIRKAEQRNRKDLDVKHQLPVAKEKTKQNKTDIVVLPSQNAQFHDFIPIAPKRRERFKHDQSFHS